MRVLLLAEDCNPEWSSTPSFTYQAARAIAARAEVVVATQIRNAGAVERAGGIGAAEVVYLDTERIAAPLWKLGVALRGGTESGWLLAHILGYPSRIAFEWMAARRFRQALRRGVFDLVHRLSPSDGIAPSVMANSCPVPFLLGPINDSLPWPDLSTEVMGRERNRTDAIAGALLPTVLRLPYQRSKYVKAAGILACYEHTMAGLPVTAKDRAINFPEVGIDPAIFSLPIRRPQPRKTVLFVGRLVPLKLPEVVIRAFAASDILRQHRLLVVGDGPDRPRLEQMISEYGLASCVELTGWQPLTGVGALMRQADIFAFPSIREMGGGVVVEAMACGLACVVVDHGGPATFIAPDRGIKVPTGDVPRLTASFTRELERLVTQPERVTRLGLAAHRHAMTYYAWDAKARKTLEIYEWATGQRARKPDFWDQPAIEPAGSAAGQRK